DRGPGGAGGGVVQGRSVEAGAVVGGLGDGGGIEDHLTALAGAQPVRFDTPGWIARDVGEPA
ncbi:MAG: hypothetical protein ACRDOI_46240, partial [Trebonia sp.]